MRGRAISLTGADSLARRWARIGRARTRYPPHTLHPYLPATKPPSVNPPSHTPIPHSILPGLLAPCAPSRCIAARAGSAGPPGRRRTAGLVARWRRPASGDTGPALGWRRRWGGGGTKKRRRSRAGSGTGGRGRETQCATGRAGPWETVRERREERRERFAIRPKSLQSTAGGSGAHCSRTREAGLEQGRQVGNK